MESKAETNTRSTLIQRARVPLGFFFGLVFLVFSKPTPSSLLVGSVIALAGLVLRLWAAGCLEKHKELCLTGPYRWTRNPLYLGSFVMGIGFCLASAQIWLLALFLLLFLVVYMPVIRREQLELHQAYGTSYGDYIEKVPAFFPTFGSVPETGSSTFRWEQVLKNREYNAALGFLALCGVLLIKVFYQL
jgi:protein-S-isoprenylcysteine O-methyltransferase Ste14